MSRRGGGGRPFHSAFATTFSIDFTALEEVMLPQLMASGATNLLIIADERMASMSLSDGSRLPVQLGREYALASPPVRDGLFHPKLVLQVGRKAGRLFVGSANVTGAGLAGNAETVVELECSDEQSPEREIVRAAWRFVSGLVSEDAGAARDAVSWAADRAPWLVAQGDDEPVQDLEDGSSIAFLTREEGVGIAERFTTLVGDAPVERLVVASPYWDGELMALTTLVGGLGPECTMVLLDEDGHEFPLEAPRPAGIEFRALPRTNAFAGRFKHAKFVIASTAMHDHVLVGSANCTVAALGRFGFSGTNQEACIYRGLPRDGATGALDLADCIAAGPMDPADATRLEPPPPIPLEAIEDRRPGSFELEGHMLAWRPPPGSGGSGWLVLLDRSGVELGRLGFELSATSLTRWTGRVELDRPEAVGFVLVEQNGVSSNRGHVTQRSALRRARREMATGSLARAAAVFDAGDDFDLWMHGAFEELARADLANRPAPPIPRIRPHAADGAADEVPPRELSYEQFMELRTRDDRGDDGRESALSGSHSDSVRGFLNMLIGRTPVADGEVDRHEDWLDLGDEDEDRELDEETRRLEAETGSEPDGHEVSRIEVDAAHFEKTVRLYVANANADAGSLGPSDVLRVRFWLMMLLLKARHPGLPRGLETSSDERGWPRMVLRVVSSFFCGRRPPITRLMVSREYTAMPVDFLECWATVLWTLDAIEAVLAAPTRHRQFIGFVQRARAEVVRILALTPAELASETVIDIRNALDRTIGTKLGLMPT